jgi:hypothetical protein
LGPAIIQIGKARTKTARRSDLHQAVINIGFVAERFVHNEFCATHVVIFFERSTHVVMTADVGARRGVALIDFEVYTVVLLLRCVAAGFPNFPRCRAPAMLGYRYFFLGRFHSHLA